MVYKIIMYNKIYIQETKVQLVILVNDADIRLSQIDVSKITDMSHLVDSSKKKIIKALCNGMYKM